MKRTGSGRSRTTDERDRRRHRLSGVLYGGRLSEPRACDRHADIGGALMTSREFCLKHGRERVERDWDAGFRVFNDREHSTSL